MIVQRLHDETSHPLSALVVDGNRTSTRQLNAVLEEHPRITVRCAAKTIASAQIQLTRHRPDVIFVDVSVAQGAGLAAVARLFASGQAIVVVADRPDFACEAFEFGAVDYLLKPIQEQRLQATVIRIDRFFGRSKASSENVASESASMPPPSVDRVPLPAQRSTTGAMTDVVPVANVIWVESLQNYSIVQLPGSERRSIKRTLTDWESLLPRTEFVRIGRFHLIQLAKLRAISSPSRNEWLAHFHDVEKPLRLGRAAASKLKGILRGSHPA
jgi:DNA-binding LytR/AlgR family response regulator